MSRGKILLLDDEVIVAMALADDLEAEGFEIVGPFSNTDRAIAALDQARPDAALLDVNLGRGRTSYPLASRLGELGIPSPS